jgi:hypothetical protein
MARESEGRSPGLPYNWRRPRREDVGKGIWDPDDGASLTPRSHGWSDGINFAAIVRRLKRR